MAGILIFVALSAIQRQSKGPVSLIEAQQMVAASIASSKNREANHWNKSPRLTEITTNDVRTRLRAQVFKLTGYTGNVAEPDSYLITDRKAYPLGVGFGGWGLTSMAVCDLDHDGVPELAYTYSWGSGLHRSHLALMKFKGARPDSRIETRFTISDIDLVLKPTKQEGVEVYVSKNWPPNGATGPLVGYLKFASHELFLIWKSGLDPKIRKLVMPSRPIKPHS